jgi:hypothetical protein
MARRASCSASAESRQRADSIGPEPAIAWLGLAHSTLVPAPRSHVTARIRLCSFCIVRDSSRAPLPLAPHAAGGRVKPDWRLPVYVQSEHSGRLQRQAQRGGRGQERVGREPAPVSRWHSPFRLRLPAPVRWSDSALLRPRFSRLARHDRMLQTSASAQHERDNL